MIVSKGLKGGTESLKVHNSSIVHIVFSVSSICMIWVFPIHSTSVRKITESSVIFLRNGVLILNEKENKEATAICFRIRIPKKKNKKSKIYGSNFILEKNKKKFWVVYISEYHIQAMELCLVKKKTGAKSLLP